MKARLGWMAGGVVLGWVVATGAQPALSVDEAAQRIGETVTFEGTVAGVASSPQFKATYLSFGGAYPFQKLSVLFAGEHEELLNQFPPFNGLTVRVTGSGLKRTRGAVLPANRLIAVQNQAIMIKIGL